MGQTSQKNCGIYILFQWSFVMFHFYQRNCLKHEDSLLLGLIVSQGNLFNGTSVKVCCIFKKSLSRKSCWKKGRCLTISVMLSFDQYDTSIMSLQLVLLPPSGQKNNYCSFNYVKTGKDSFQHVGLNSNETLVHFDLKVKLAFTFEFFH